MLFRIKYYSSMVKTKKVDNLKLIYALIYGYYVRISSLVSVRMPGVEFLFWTLIRNKRTPLAPRCLVQFVLTGYSNSQHLRSKAVIGVTHLLSIKYVKIQYLTFPRTLMRIHEYFLNACAFDHYKILIFSWSHVFKALEAILFSKVFSLFERLWKRHLSFKLLSRPN